MNFFYFMKQILGRIMLIFKVVSSFLGNCYSRFILPCSKQEWVHLKNNDTMGWKKICMIFSNFRPFCFITSSVLMLSILEPLLNIILNKKSSVSFLSFYIFSVIHILSFRYFLLYIFLYRTIMLVIVLFIKVIIK